MLAEAFFPLSVFSVVLGAIALVSLTSAGIFRGDTTQEELKHQAQLTTDRIVRELESCPLNSIVPHPLEPFGSDVLTYQFKNGIEAEQVLWDAPRRVELRFDVAQPEGADDAGMARQRGSIHWLKNAGMLGQREIVWCRNVARYLEGELPNGKDDNGNGLIDEPGLCFKLVDDEMFVFLTLESQAEDGSLLQCSKRAAVRLGD